MDAYGWAFGGEQNDGGDGRRAWDDAMTCCATSVRLLDVDGNMYNFIYDFMVAIRLASDGGILVFVFKEFNCFFKAYILERCDM